MQKQKPKIFDFFTIFLLVILLSLVFAIGGILFWKEQNIEVEFKFFGKNGKFEDLDKIGKGDKITISFSGPVRTESVDSGLVFEPKIDFSSKWKSDHQLDIVLEESPFPDFNYQLMLGEFKGKWGLVNDSEKISFSTDPLPKLSSITPQGGQEGVSIKPEIFFEFENVLADQYFLKIKTEPVFEFESVETKEKNKIIIRPVADLAFDREYKISAELKSKNHFDFNRKIGETNFKTRKPPVVVYGWNSEGVPIRTEPRTNFIEPSIKVGRYIDIDLSDQNLYIFENGQEIGAYKISSGLRGMDTPVGEFKVLGRSRRPWSKKYSLYMPWFIQFTYEGHGIHELPEWPGGYKEGTNHLGIPVSHGCVRLGIGPAKKVYDFVEVGTPLVIHY